MNLVVFSPNWLGDAVMALPAIRDLRRHVADGRLTVAARPAIAPLFTMVEGVDQVTTLSAGGGMRTLASIREDAAQLASHEFDAAVLLPNSFASALVAYRAAIPERWGFAADFRGRLLTRSLARPKGLTQADYYQALVAALGVETGPQYARLAAPAAVPGGVLPQGPFAVLAPGAAYGRAKQWPPERFAELAAALMRDLAWSVVLVGSAADAAVCADIAVKARTTVGAGPVDGLPSIVDASGRTTLPELAAVMARAQAIVSNDSGAMHLASAVGRPVVAVFGPTNETRTAPLASGPDAPRPVVVTSHVWCRPCMLRECPIDHRCMTDITAGSVVGALSGEI
jgi:heptosyltransferase-2